MTGGRGKKGLSIYLPRMALGRFVVLNKEVTAGPGRTPQACIWWGGRQCPHTLLLKRKKETCFSSVSLVDSSVLLRTPLCITISRNLPLSYCFCSAFHLEHCGSSVSWSTSVLRKGERMHRGDVLERTPHRETPSKKTNYMSWMWLHSDRTAKCC